MMNRISTCVAIVGLSLAGVACQSTSTASNSDFTPPEQNQPNDKMPAAANSNQPGNFDNSITPADSNDMTKDTPGNVGTNLNGNASSANER